MSFYSTAQETPKDKERAPVEGNIISPDSVILSDEITRVITTADPNAPKRAAYYSLAFPGGGQFYNKQAHLVPIIYGVYAGLIYGVTRFHRKYRFWLAPFIAEVDGDANTVNLSGLSQSNLERLKDSARRNRDYMGILILAVHGLQAVQAHVQAHLVSFDVNDDLTFAVDPSMVRNPWDQAAFGISFKLAIK